MSAGRHGAETGHTDEGLSTSSSLIPFLRNERQQVSLLVVSANASISKRQKEEGVEEEEKKKKKKEKKGRKERTPGIQNKTKERQNGKPK